MVLHGKTWPNRSGFGLRPDEELLDEEDQRRQNRRRAPVFLGFVGGVTRI